MLPFVAAFIAAAVQPTEPEGGCVRRLCNAASVAPVLASLRALEPGRSLHIVQIGDSHTAGDMITGAWRDRLQARLGDGGRGVLAAGRPYAGYLTWGVTATQSENWQASAIFGNLYRPDGPPIGLSGFTQSGSEAGEWLGVRADIEAQRIDRITVCAIMAPGAGTIALRAGSREQRWRLDAPARRPACRSVEGREPFMGAEIEVLDRGPVAITSFATFRNGGGIVLSNLGVVGAQFAHFGRADVAVLRTELDAYRPDLIVLAFGTNEGFSPTLTADHYETGLRDQISRLRGLAGTDVPMLLLGAPDAARRTPARGGDGDCGNGWSVPALLGEVRRRQARVARDLGLAYWDWSGAMGGRCASIRWHESGDMRPDRVHFTRSGGARVAALLDQALLESAPVLPSVHAGERGF